MPNKSEEPKFALALSIGTIISSNIVGGVLVGYFIDRWLDKSPWFSVTGLILGTIGAFVGTIRVMSKLNR